MPTRTARTIAAAVSVVLAFVAIGAAGYREFEREVEATTLRVVHVEAGARLLGPAEPTHMQATIVLAVDGPPLARLAARAVSLDLSLEAMPLGHVVARAESPGRFVVDTLSEIDAPSTDIAAYRRALTSQAATLNVVGHGTLFFPLGHSNEVTVRDSAPVTATLATSGDAAAFQGIAGRGAGSPPSLIK